MATSYNGWPASPYPSLIGINSKWAPLGRTFPGGIKAGDVQTVMTYLVLQLNARVEPISLYTPGDEWGYNYRANVNNPSSLSCHASGTAIDYNATRHPNGKRGTFSAAQVRSIRQILAEIGVIRWGGDFSGTPDEMHFEINASPSKVAAAAQKLSGSLQPPTPAPFPVPPEPEPVEEEEMKAHFAEYTDKPTDRRTFLILPFYAAKIPIGATTYGGLIWVDAAWWGGRLLEKDANGNPALKQYSSAFLDPIPEQPAL